MVTVSRAHRMGGASRLEFGARLYWYTDRKRVRSRLHKHIVNGITCLGPFAAYSAVRDLAESPTSADDVAFQLSSLSEHPRTILLYRDP